MRAAILLSVLILVLVAPARAQHTHGTPAGDRTHRDPTSYMAALDDPGRDSWQKPADVIAALGLQPGHVVVDIGAGSGYFTLRFAPTVRPAGKVLAVDVSAAMLEHLSDRATRMALDNVVTVLAAPDDPRVEPGSADVVFTCNTWHHIEDRGSYLSRIRAALAPGGRFAIVDFRMDAAAGPSRELRLRREDVVAEVARAGFQLAAEHTFLPHQYFLVFTVAPAAGAAQ